MGGNGCGPLKRGYPPERDCGTPATPTTGAVEKGEKIIVGVNEYVVNEDPPGDSAYRGVGARVAERANSNGWRAPAIEPRRVEAEPGRAPGTALALEAGDQLGQPFRTQIPCLIYWIVCAPYATLGEICDAMRAVLGTYQEARRFLNGWGQALPTDRNGG